jgi:hypothetical protein
VVIIEKLDLSYLGEEWYGAEPHDFGLSRGRKLVMVDDPNVFVSGNRALAGQPGTFVTVREDCPSDRSFGFSTSGFGTVIACVQRSGWAWSPTRGHVYLIAHVVVVWSVEPT